MLNCFMKYFTRSAGEKSCNDNNLHLFPKKYETLMNIEYRFCFAFILIDGHHILISLIVSYVSL